MNKHTKTVVTLVAVTAVVAAIFHFGTGTKKKYAKMIIRMNGTSAALPVLITMDEGYLKSWAKALSKSKTNFSYNGENYNTAGGKKIVV